MVVGFCTPARAHAGVLNSILSTIGIGKEVSASEVEKSAHELPALTPAHNVDPASVATDGDIGVVNDTALLPAEGPSGTIADIERPKNPTISVHIVKNGDTVANIAKMFNVSAQTIYWANDIKPNTALKVGQRLTILPITGMRHVVVKGDSVSSIAKRYNADEVDIRNFNNVGDGSLFVGSVIIIPDSDVGITENIVNPKVAKSKTKTKSSKSSMSNPLRAFEPYGSASEISYYVAPVKHYVKTQGLHGYNAVDLAAPKGTEIYASAGGEVTVAQEGGWNGGYGNYVVISHGNGSQTLYAHLGNVSVSAGDRVQKGQFIGVIGMTGRTTGPHLHFEIRNGIRNPF